MSVVRPLREANTNDRKPCEERCTRTMEASVQYQRAAEMLARAAHELNTPLSVIGGYIDVLSRETMGSLTPQQRTIMQSLQTSTGRLKKVVQDFLAFSTVESGVVMRFEEGDVNACLLEICSFWQSRYQQRGVMLYSRLQDKIAPFKFDFYRVQRVLSNLLDNALRFSSAGSSVWVNAEAVFWERRSRSVSLPLDRRSEANTAQANAVRVVVSDMGPGVPAELQHEIFKEFFKTEHGGDGVGLGLAIARRIVEAHGGRIWVESTPGATTNFCYVLPFVTSPARGSADCSTEREA